MAECKIQCLQKKTVREAQKKNPLMNINIDFIVQA